jgi:hypothetical protein
MVPADDILTSCVKISCRTNKGKTGLRGTQCAYIWGLPKFEVVLWLLVLETLVTSRSLIPGRTWGQLNKMIAFNMFNNNVDINYRRRPFQEFFIQTILRGTDQFSKETNLEIFKITHEFIRESHRFPYSDTIPSLSNLTMNPVVLSKHITISCTYIQMHTIYIMHLYLCGGGHQNDHRVMCNPLWRNTF